MDQSVEVGGMLARRVLARALVLLVSGFVLIVVAALVGHSWVVPVFTAILLALCAWVAWPIKDAILNITAPRDQ